ncbi:MAG: signal peptidase I [Dehalococcoidales bacterium]
MKRAIVLIFLTAACIVAFLAVRGSMPFIPIYGSSMEPTLTSGSLLFINPIEPKDVKVGDIIVYTVPPMVRDYYNYPPTVAHRVIKIAQSPTLGFRTQGDNTGEDPFTIRPEDIRGTVGSQIPYLGLPLLFFQSQQGLIFAIIALLLLAIFLYGGEIGRGGGWIHRGFFSPVIVEEKKANRALARQLEGTEKRMEHTEEALEQFSAAVTEYAKHLASHTSAIQGLSEASHELKRGASEQNRVLSAIMDNVTKSSQKRETVIIKEVVSPPTPKPEIKKPAVKTLPYHGALTKGIVGYAQKHTWHHPEKTPSSHH